SRDWSSDVCSSDLPWDAWGCWSGFPVRRLRTALRSRAFLQYPPAQGFAGAQRHQAVFAERQFGGRLPVLAHQGDAVGVARQAVEIGTELAGEALQPVQCVARFERLGVQLDGGVGGVAAGAAAGGFLGVTG